MDYETARNMPPIDANDPQALDKTRARVEAYREEYERRKAVNAFYKQRGTLTGCPHTTPEEEELTASLETSCRGNLIPYGKKSMDNIGGSIRSFERRIAELERRESEPPPEGWKIDGGEVVMNIEENLLQIVFEERPSLDTIINMKMLGFVLGPHEGPFGAWQRGLTDRAIEAARRLFPSET